MTALQRISDAVARAAIYLAAFVIVAMCFHVAASIVMRTVFSSSLNGTVEIVSYYYMVVVAFAPLAWAQRHDEHIAVDVLHGLMSPRVRLATRFAANLISIAMLSFLAWAMIEMALRQTRVGELIETGAVDVPIWPARWIAAAGVAAMIVVLLAQLTRRAAPPAPAGDDGREAGL